MFREGSIVCPDSLIDQLRCIVCKEFLSSSPIRVQFDGNCICGQCSSAHNDFPVYRVFAFEAILNKISFPCCFKGNGCKKMMSFGEVVDHESKCAYRFYTCPVLPIISCSWEGSTLQMSNHFSEQHSHLIAESNTIIFTIHVAQQSKGVCMVSKNDITFIVKYLYEAVDKNLKYHVRFCINENVTSAFYRIKLVDETHTECAIHLKSVPCRLYDFGFNDLKNSTILNINDALFWLNDPTTIVITIEFDVNLSGDAKRQIIDFDLLESIRCSKCWEYLVPPLFNLNDLVVCSNCAKISQSAIATAAALTDINQLINRANYPCRWRECNFVGKCDTIKEHEMLCDFRYTSCGLVECKEIFKMNQAIVHLESHNIRYVSDRFNYELSFAEEHEFRHVFTIKHKRIVLFGFSMFDKHQVYLKSPSSDKITGRLQFEHRHCKLKSKIFDLEANNFLHEISTEDLPRCFQRNDVLTAFVFINIS